MRKKQLLQIVIQYSMHDVIM